MTRRFGDLQGLRVAAFGAALVAGFVAVRALPADFANHFLHMTLPAQCVLLATTPAFDRFYARAFGRVGAGAMRRFSASPPGGAGAAALGPFVVLAGMFADMLSGFVVAPPVSLGCAALCRIFDVDRRSRLAVSNSPHDRHCRWHCRRPYHGRT